VISHVRPVLAPSARNLYLLAVLQHGPSLRSGRARELTSRRSVSLDVLVNCPG
jgi:hypothetical protein